MQNSILNSIRSLKLIDGCKGNSQVYALNPTSIDKPHHQNSISDPFKLRSSSSLRIKSLQLQTSVTPDTLLPYGLPSLDLIDPPIDPFLRSVDPIPDLASAFRRLNAAKLLERCDLYLEQRSLLRALNDPKLLRRSLRLARIHSPDLHHKIVLSAWLRYERREDELEKHSTSSSLSAEAAVGVSCSGPSIECPRAALLPGYNPEMALDTCPCRCPTKPLAAVADYSSIGSSTSAEAAVAESFLEEDEVEDEDEEEDEEDEEGDIIFCIDEDEVPCFRDRIATLSMPLRTMLYGDFTESRRETINFSKNGIPGDAMRVVEVFSRTRCLGDDLQPSTVLEVLAFANKFCCEGLKAACDSWLALLVHSFEEAIVLVDYGLEETAHLLVGACLQIFLRELPRSLHKSQIIRLFCSPDGRERLASSGHASFALYYMLSQVAMEEDMRSNTTVMLLERLGECAAPGWQKQLALHQLGCVMLERNEYEDAQKWFEEAVREGHVYSLAGVTRAKYRRGNRYAAFKMINNLVCDYDVVGWMYQEMSLYCIGKDEKLRDLDQATKFDPTLPYPYKYRAILLMEDNKLQAAIAEINKIIAFKVSTDCLELRAWFFMAKEEYSEALRDIRALMTLDPHYMMFHGKVHGDQLIEVLQHHVPQMGLADCWMELYDRWSAVDDIGSLAVVHQMLANDPCKSVLRFRQSLLLLRLNCQKAAMRSLRLAWNCSLHEHERLVYEGWILYDTGHREEALAKAEESISIQRSFEAFFLKAYALADTSMDVSSSTYVIKLLEEALRCPSDGLRKGQALNNLGSVYVDCDKLEQAADCYVNALNIRHTRAHQGLARVYHVKNQRKAAYDEMTKLIEKASSNASAYEKRSEYCDRDKAKSDLHKATELDPLRTYPYRYRAAVLMDDHKEDEAIAELTKAILFKPDLQLLHLRAAFYDSMGDIAATIRDCEAALCLDPNHSDTLELYQKALQRDVQK